METIAHQLVNIDGATLEVITDGTGLLPVCCTHPWADDLTPGAWDDSMARLTLINPRGKTRSSPVRRHREMTFSQLADDVEAVRTRLGIQRWVFFGHSSGGLVALLYALRYPQSLLGLIITCSASNGPAVVTDPTCDRDFRAMYERLGDGSLVSLAHRTMDLTIHERVNFDEIGVFDVHDRLGEISLPTLIVAGIVGSEFLLLEDSGHAVDEKDRDQYQTAVRWFLTRLADAEFATLGTSR